jgi:hypothetical protein
MFPPFPSNLAKLSELVHISHQATPHPSEWLHRRKRHGKYLLFSPIFAFDPPAEALIVKQAYFVFISTGGVNWCLSLVPRHMRDEASLRYVPMVNIQHLTLRSRGRF